MNDGGPEEKQGKAVLPQSGNSKIKKKVVQALVCIVALVVRVVI